MNKFLFLLIVVQSITAANVFADCTVNITFTPRVLYELKITSFDTPPVFEGKSTYTAISDTDSRDTAQLRHTFLFNKLEDGFTPSYALDINHSQFSDIPFPTNVNFSPSADAQTMTSSSKFSALKLDVKTVSWNNFAQVFIPTGVSKITIGNNEMDLKPDSISLTSGCFPSATSN